MRSPGLRSRAARAGTVLGIGLLASLSGPACAQPASGKSAPAAPTAVPSEPGLTTASFGDWVLRCQRLEGETGPRLCEVAQTMQVQGQATPIAQLAIGHLPGQDGLRVTTLLPSNVSFPSSVRVTLANDPGAGLDLAWRRCIPGGCLADAAAPEGVLKGWRGADAAGRIVFRDAEGREIVIPLSFRGLGPALDALVREKS